MNDVHSEYLTKLKQKAKATLLKEYPLLGNLEFESFILVNAYLVHRAIENKVNTLFHLPGKEYKKNYHVPTLLMLAIQSFIKNWIEQDYPIEVGDVLLEADGSTRKIISITNDELAWKKLDGNNTRGKFSEIQARKYPIITGVWRRTKIKTKLRSYQNFFKDLFNCPQHEIPYKFKNKTLVIASKKVTEELKQFTSNGKSIYKSFPFEYVWERRDGSIGRDCNLPIEPMIYITNDFELAQNHLLISNGEENIETVIFIGSTQYRDCIPSITNAINRQQIKSVILIGSEDVEHLPNLNKWKWYIPEINLLNDQETTPPALNMVENPEMEMALYSASFVIKAIEDDFEVLLSELNIYLRKLASINIPNSNSRVNQLVNQIWEKFENDGVNIVSDAFYNAGYYDDEETENWSVIKEQFRRLFNASSSSFCKYNRLKTLEGVSHVVVPKNQIEAWDAGKKEKEKVKFISFSEFRTLHSKKKTSVAFLGFYGMEQLKTMLKSPYQCTLLLYQHEKEFYDRSISKYNNLLLAEINTDWRRKLSDVAFEIAPEKESLSDLLMRFEESGSAGEGTYEYDEVEHDLIIEFEDGEKRLTQTNYRFLVKSSNGFLEMAAEVLKKGEVIVVYSNLEKERLYEVALNADKTDVFSRIEESSLIWKDALRSHFQKLKLDEEYYHQKLKNAGLKVGIETFRNWLKPNCQVKFPQREKDLHAIRSVVNNPLLNERLGDIFQKRAIYKSIMISLGHGLSEEVTQYLKTNGKDNGKILRQFSDKQIKSILDQNIQLKTISQIKVISNNGQQVQKK